MMIDTPATLSDTALDAELKRLAAHERDVTVALVVHLAELDTRKLHLGLGFSSLFSYCRNALSLSEHATYHRIVAARAVRRHPVIAAMLSEGSLNLSTLRLLAPHLTPENASELLEAARGGSKRGGRGDGRGAFPPTRTALLDAEGARQGASRNGSSPVRPVRTRGTRRPRRNRTAPDRRLRSLAQRVRQMRRLERRPRTLRRLQPRLREP